MMSLKYDFNTNLDDPLTTVRHRDIILSKNFLKKIYLEWYSNFQDVVNKNSNGNYLEIGSGGGFLDELLPTVITSDIMPLPSVQKQFSAEEMPFKNNYLDGIFMVNVLHHIPKPHKFFKEAERTLKSGGSIVMVEPVNTLLSKFIYTNFHHEPFVVDGGWEIDSTGPLSGANGAIPWIYLVRDKEKFEREFPSLKIEKIKLHTALRYTLSGGVSRKCLVPEFTFDILKFIEKIPLVNSLGGMFGTYTIRKI